MSNVGTAAAEKMVHKIAFITFIRMMFARILKSFSPLAVTNVANNFYFYVNF